MLFEIAMDRLQLAYFSIAWFLIIYLFNSVLAKRLKPIQLPEALLYMSTVAMVGVFGEVLVDSLYNHFVGVPLWQYHILPIHYAYTSYYSIVIWSLYGFYLYLLHDHLGTYRIHSTKVLAGIISLEAIVLEILFNTSHLLLYHQYIFYYLPHDLWHVTSLQAIPFYFIAGVVITKSIRAFKSSPIFFTMVNIILVTVLVFLT